MIEEGQIVVEKNKIAIVVVGYNKYNGLLRLLDSISHADYGSEQVPLVISIDASGNQDVYDLALNYEWKHGVKYVNIEKERLGLKDHIFQCASLTKYFKAVVLLEDDLMVSPYFYNYCNAVLDKYSNDNKVAGVALYRNEANGFVGLPFQPYENGYDVFAWQSVCSWGEMWNERMWNDFISWYEKWDKDFAPIDMPKRIKEWTRAWSKFYYAYMIMNDKYFIYPYQSLSTNFNDAGGEHGGGNASIVQVSLMMGPRNYNFGDFDRLVKYDVYGQNMDIHSWLGLKKEDITVDLYGLKDSYKGRYVLSIINLPYKQIRGFALNMRPLELNLKYNLEGDSIILYDRESTAEIIPPARIFDMKIVAYYLCIYDLQLLRSYIWDGIKNSIKHKLNLKKK